MQVKVDDIAASCPQCQTAEFITAGGAGQQAKLVCESCGHETTRAQLLIQIGDKAARQATESLAQLRQQRSGKNRLLDS